MSLIYTSLKRLMAVSAFAILPSVIFAQYQTTQKGAAIDGIAANGLAKSIYSQPLGLSAGSSNFYSLQNDTLEEPFNYRKSKIFSISLYLDWISGNFREFANEIGNDNADYLSSKAGFAGLELSYYGNKGGFFGFRFSGFLWLLAPNGSYNSVQNGSLELQNRLTQVGMHVGYTILKTKYVNVTPKVAFNWNRHRLLNYTSGSTTLAQYVDNLELDVRFNQFVGTVGATINVNFIKKKKDLTKEGYFSIGFTGAYCFKFHQKPLVYSAAKALDSNSSIYYHPFCFSIYISANAVSF